jgi:hypothetical protein
MKLRSAWLPAIIMSAALVTLLLVVQLSSSSAATVGGNGLRVSPVRNDITIQPGQTGTVNISVTNVTSVTSNLGAIINDFIANPNESGQPSIILDPNQYAPRRSLKRYAKPIPNFTLRPGEQKTITLTIEVPKNAAGGYFGAVRFGPASESPAGPGENVSLASNVGSLILLKVPGNVTEKLSLASFDARSNDRPGSIFTSNKKIDAVVRFQNSGDIQVEPFGKVLLKDRSGKLISSFEVNSTEPRGTVLPDSIRKFSVPLSKVGTFGKYKLEGNFSYGTGGQLLSASATFYVVPLWLIIAFIALVLFVSFLVFGLPRLIRAYNRRILRRAGRR